MTDTDATAEDTAGQSTPDSSAGTAVAPVSVTVVENDALEFHVSELVAGEAGASSPFGPDRVFPLPVEDLWYAHPRPEDRPNLAGGL